MITNIKDLVPKNEIQRKNISKAIKKGIFNKGQIIIIDNKHLYEIICFYWGCSLVEK